MTCTKCGASLGDADKFCGKCGAARAESISTAAPQKFCQSCGTPFSTEDRFCAKCGAPRGQAASQTAPPPGPTVTSDTRPATQQYAPAPSSQLSSTPPSVQPAISAPLQAAEQPTHSKKGSSKVIFAILAVILLFGVTAVAGIVYVGYRAKKKVDEIRQEAISGNTMSSSGDSSEQTAANAQGGQADQANQGGGAAGLLKALAGATGQKQQGNSSSGQGDNTDAAMKNLIGNAAEGIMKNMMGAGGAPAAKLPEWKSAAADLVSSPASKVPLRVSLRLVVTGTEARGDYESIFAVDSVSAQQIHITAHQQFPKAQKMRTVMAQSDAHGFTGSDPGSPDAALKINCSQIELQADLANATSMSPYFCLQGREDKFPGTTSLGLSRKIFADLKAGKDVSFITYENPYNAMFKSFKDLVTGSGDPSEFLNRVLSAAPGGTPPPTPPIHLTLRRKGPDIAFPVLVNDQPTQLPALHIVGAAADGSNYGDVFVLDDSNNPLILAAQTTANGTGQITKIYWNPDTPNAPNPIEQQLEKQGRAKIYGIYFDFGSNQLRAESEPVLNEIVATMKAHPDWKLRIEGHTDNIGGDTYNQNLSASRANEVKKALTSMGISGDHLDSQGFGDTRPATTNDTIEGRALNRRVELVRE